MGVESLLSSFVSKVIQTRKMLPDVVLGDDVELKEEIELYCNSCKC